MEVNIHRAWSDLYFLLQQEEEEEGNFSIQVKSSMRLGLRKGVNKQMWRLLQLAHQVSGSDPSLAAVDRSPSFRMMPESIGISKASDKVDQNRDAVLITPHTQFIYLLEEVVIRLNLQWSSALITNIKLSKLCL